MREHLARAVVVTALAGVGALPASAAESLIGERLSFLRAYPTSTTPYLSPIPDTTVVAGPADRVQWVVSGLTYTTIDPEADRIDFFLLGGSGYVSQPGIFDGYVISGFSRDIQSVTLLANGSGLAIDLSHDARAVFVDLAGTTPFASGFSVGVALAPAVPEPAPWLMAAAGIGVLLLRRRRAS